METIDIKQVSLNDLDALQAIARHTFYESFASENTPENMARYMEEGFSMEKMTAELANPDSRFYFAQIGEVLAGYSKLNGGSAQTEAGNANALEIERIYVRREYYGKQVGQALLEHAVAEARQAQAPYIWLGVWERNPRAIRFYVKNGFVAYGTHQFVLGDDVQTDVLMRRAF